MTSARARDILSHLNCLAKVNDFAKLAETLLRTMQPWGIATGELEHFTDEDEELLTRFWRDLFGAAQLTDTQLKQHALKLYAMVLGAAARPEFKPIVRVLLRDCRRIGEVALALWEEGREVKRKKPQLPALVAVMPLSPAPKPHRSTACGFHPVVYQGGRA